MPDFFASVAGGDALRKRLRKLQPQFVAEMARVLPEEGRELIADAQSGVPARSGTLAASALVTTFTNQRQVRVAAAYTDTKAAAVHEGLHWGRHIQGTRGFKWYEKALNQFRGGFVQRVASQLRGVLERGRG